MHTRIAAVVGGILAVVSPAQSQQWPTGPVTMIIPFAAGGPTDVLGRIVGERLGKTFG